jgi:hypothetical protein
MFAVLHRTYTEFQQNTINYYKGVKASQTYDVLLIFQSPLEKEKTGLDWTYNCSNRKYI